MQVRVQKEIKYKMDEWCKKTGECHSVLIRMAIVKFLQDIK